MARGSSAALVRGVFALALFLAIARPLVAQKPTGAVTGTVTDRSTGATLANVEITLLAGRRSVVSDSLGRYELLDVPVGVAQLVVRATSFPSVTILVEVLAGQSFVRLIALDSSATGRGAQALPAVGVSATAPVENYRLVGFEQRRKTGRGQYLTEEQILKSGAYSLADAVRPMRGVNYECGGGGGCFVRMARAPMMCLPQYIIDDRAIRDFGPSTPIRDIIGLEVYTGPSDVPGEYAGSNAACGVIVIHTRSGPARRRP